MLLSLPLWLLAAGLLLEVLLTLYADHRAERNIWRINEIADAHRRFRLYAICFAQPGDRHIELAGLPTTILRPKATGAAKATLQLS